MMTDKKRTMPNRIPIHFADEDNAAATNADADATDAPETGTSGAGDLTPEEIGRASSYEGETETQRRVNRGQEQEGASDMADDADTAGGPPQDELPEQREDSDPTSASREAAAQSDSGGSSAADDSSRQDAGAAKGPALAELLATRSELKRVEAERTELKETLARRQADFENYRKRIERERADTYNRVVGDVVSKLLPVLDNLRRALDAEASMEAAESDEFRHFLNGVELIDKQLQDVLEGLGLQPVEAVGQPFDPHIHEAVATEPSVDYEPDTVVQELARGYRLGEKLLRPAIVKVAVR
ncbi:MAG: molecular chaperone GrpE [Blastocatellia bacterium]|jgi:molecular chaperone GrpE|nr:molecular chaperone GrpE [Blastocatellia bacterium]